MSSVKNHIKRSNRGRMRTREVFADFVRRADMKEYQKSLIVKTNEQ